MNNKLSDLNNHLFAQLEKLGDESLKGEELKTEIERSKAMAMIANNIVGAAKTTVDAFKLIKQGHVRKEDLPALITSSK